MKIYAALGISVLSLFGGACDSCEVERPVQRREVDRVSFEDAKRDTSKRQVYVNQLAENKPGYITGIFYSSEPRGDTTMMCPSVIDIESFGEERTKSPIIVYPAAFDGKFGEEADFLSRLEDHEYWHAERTFRGFDLDKDVLVKTG